MNGKGLGVLVYVFLGCVRPRCPFLVAFSEKEESTGDALVGEVGAAL